MENNELTISQAGQWAYANAISKGFYKDFDRLLDLVSVFGTHDDVKFLRQIWLSHRLMLIVSELAEGLEAIRDSNMSSVPKSGGLGEELADAGIRLVDLCQHINIELEKAMKDKMVFNESRPYKHGRSL